MYWSDVVSHIRANAGLAPDASLAEVREAVEERLLKKRLRNRLLGGNVREEDSPGNYTIHKTPAGIVLRTYDLAGFPTDTVVDGDSFRE